MADAGDPSHVVMVGAGGHARVVAEALLPRRVIGHLTPENTDHRIESLLGDRLGGDDAAVGLAAAGCTFALGVGSVDRRSVDHRAELLETLAGCHLEVVRHARAIVSPTADLSGGSFIGPGAIVGTGARLAMGSIVNSGAVIDHDCRIGRNVHVAPGAVVSGDVTIDDDALIGVGSTIRQGLRIGSRVVVGAGAVVIDDLVDGVTVVGVPARPVGG